ncbi:MAG: hypothetical protein ACUVWO_16600, partial [Thermodesulfobacteriota bacterium]
LRNGSDLLTKGSSLESSRYRLEVSVSQWKISGLFSFFSLFGLSGHIIHFVNGREPKAGKYGCAMEVSR